MRVIRASDCRAMPWKNGGGTTTEIAVHPEGAGFDRFDWRISMARVAQDGPFSAFAGIDRVLTVLDGAGIRLRLGADAPVTLTPASPPHAFAGDVPCDAALIDGPITDLNVMARRGRWQAEVTAQGALPFTLAAVRGVAVLVVVYGVAEVGGHRLGPRDCLLLEGVESVLVLPEAGFRGLGIDLSPIR